MMFKSLVVVRYTTHYDDIEDYHEVTFNEMREAVRFTRDHAYHLRSTCIERRVVKQYTGTFKFSNMIRG